MLYIDKTNKTPIYEQLYSQLMEAIMSGSIAPGSALPATRRLAEDLAISRNTVNKAYHQLAAEGYIQPRAGSGFTINPIPVEMTHTQAPKPIKPAPQPAPFRYDFDYGNIDNQAFPYRQWRKSVNRVLDAAEILPNILYPHYMGEMPLREEIARYLYRSRSVKCTAEQIIITCGHQHSVEILANLFRCGKKRCAMEDPGYDGIRSVFLNHDYHMDYIAVEEDGLDISQAERLPLDLLYVTPSHQFPTGAVLSVAKRLRLLDWAHKTGAYIIEDDYDSELRYHTDPIPSMQSLDCHDSVIYTGTFSKALSPAIRIAYMVLPPELLERYHQFYQLYGSQVSPLHQLALADFIANGCFERNVNRLRTLYRKKQDALKAAISKVFGETIRVSGEGAGLHLLLDIDTDIPPEVLIEEAASIDVKLYSVKPYYADCAKAPKCQIQFGFPTISQEQFVPILARLKEVWGLL